MILNHFEKFALKLSSSFILCVSIVFAINVYALGKTSAGGGFQAGAILASGVILYEFINDTTLASLKRLQFLAIFGIWIFIFTGIASVFFGGSLFDYVAFSRVFGHKFGVFCVETGVFFVVLASLVKIFRSL